MHDGQLSITTATVRALVEAQFPDLGGPDVVPVPSYGTVNALFRLGDRHVLRFPLEPTPGTHDELVAEQAHARRIAAHVPVAVPEPVGVGAPGPGYDGAWSVWHWLAGTSADRAQGWDEAAVAADLAAFVRALRTIDTGGRTWPGHGRGGPLAPLDAELQGLLDDLPAGFDVDTGGIRAVWQDALDATPWSGAAPWVHADLMPGNLLLREGRLAAVIDLGAGRVGDPALDLMPAWNLFGPDGRAVFRRGVGVDEDTWRRGRGWAIVQALPTIAYYARTNPPMSRLGVRTLAAVVG